MLRRVWGAATSRGPGYEPQPAGPLFSADSVRGYFVDLTLKAASEARVPAFSRQPAGLAQLALAYHDLELAGDGDAGRRFVACCDLLAARAEPHKGGLLWPYSVAVPKYDLYPPWYSAMAQGQIASVFVRAAQRSGKGAYAELAMGAVEPLLAGSANLVTYTPRGPILEEAPSLPGSHILNGWIYAAWGLWDVATAFDNAGAARLLEDTMSCLRQSLALYDTGWWTRYSLYPHRIPDLAKPFYHRLHATQVQILYELFGFQEFGSAAKRWAAYDRLSSRSLAVTQKALFVALGR